MNPLSPKISDRAAKNVNQRDRHLMTVKGAVKMFKKEKGAKVVNINRKLIAANKDMLFSKPVETSLMLQGIDLKKSACIVVLGKKFFALQGNKDKETNNVRRSEFFTRIPWYIIDSGKIVQRKWWKSDTARNIKSSTPIVMKTTEWWFDKYALFELTSMGIYVK